MKRTHNIFAIVAIWLLLMTTFGDFPLMRAQGQEACCLTLPAYPANSISLELSAYYPSVATAYSYFTAKVLAGPIPLAPPSPLYPAWCMDAATDIFVAQRGNFTPYDGFLYSSCDTNLNSKLGQGSLPPEHPSSVYVSAATWKKVNYVLNHRNLAAAPYTSPPFTGPPFTPLPSFAYYWDVQEVINAYVGGPRLAHTFPLI